MIDFDIEEFYKIKLLENGFQEESPNKRYSPLGKLYRICKEHGEGFYWVYGQRDLYNIKIHDFSFHRDLLFDIETMDWPECLSINYYESVSGEEIMPYRRLTAGCVKTFFGGSKPYKAIFHKGIPIRAIGIEIMSSYYERYLNKAYPDEYSAPHDAFRSIDNSVHFPKMIALLRQVWNYRGEGMAAKLFYEAKVAEAVSLILEYNRDRKPIKETRISSQDMRLLENAAAYLNDHFNSEVSLEHLSHIACMGTTKLKSSFKQIYGCTVTEYIQQRRLSHAEALLGSADFTIEQIAQAVGYSNSGRFAGAFRKNTGIFPNEYRKIAQRK
ncbi:MAG: AraC family transcriptional regulator [Lachnospiraceae bacterium]